MIVEKEKGFIKRGVKGGGVILTSANDVIKTSADVSITYNYDS